MTAHLEAPLDLIDQSLAGDEAAFAALYDRYKNLVFRTAYLMLDSVSEAEEVLQEVFLQVYRSLGRYDPGRGAFTTWLYRLSINASLNHKRGRRFSFLPLGWLAQEPVQEQGASPETAVEEREMLAKALARLSRPLRAVVVLRYYGGQSYTEIAEALSLPVGTVKSRLNAAMSELRAVVGKEYPEISSESEEIHEL